MCIVKMKEAILLKQNFTLDLSKTYQDAVQAFSMIEVVAILQFDDTNWAFLQWTKQT